MLPDCMDLAGPTLERTVQIIEVPTSKSSLSVQFYLVSLKERQDTESQDVHAPWNLVREGLGYANPIFDAVAMSTCLNYLPVRTKNGKVGFEATQYHETKANCETAWLFDCGVEGEGRCTKLLTQILADKEIVSREDSILWTKDVMAIAAWLGDQANLDAMLHECPQNAGLMFHIFQSDGDGYQDIMCKSLLQCPCRRSKQVAVRSTG